MCIYVYIYIYIYTHIYIYIYVYTVYPAVQNEQTVQSNGYVYFVLFLYVCLLPEIITCDAPCNSGCERHYRNIVYLLTYLKQENFHHTCVVKEQLLLHSSLWVKTLKQVVMQSCLLSSFPQLGRIKNPLKISVLHPQVIELSIIFPFRCGWTLSNISPLATSQ